MLKWTWTQSSTIYYKLGGPQKDISQPKDQIFVDLFCFYLHIHLSFRRFIAECMWMCMCRRVHVLWKSCLLRRWIKQQEHLICTTLQGKYTKKWDTSTHTHTLTDLHTASKSFPSQKLFLDAATNHSFPDIISFIHIHTNMHIQTHTHADARVLRSKLHSLVVILHSHDILCVFFIFLLLSRTGFVPGKSQHEDLLGLI